MNNDIVIVAALSRDDIIGCNNEIPWHIPEDLKRFREITENSPVIMGRNTYESIINRNGGPLTKRINIVLSSGQLPDKPRRIFLEKSLDEAIRTARRKRFDNKDNIYIIGGKGVYEEALPIAGKMLLTRVFLDVPHGEYTYFPKIDWEQWSMTFEESHRKKGFSFQTYERKT